MQEDDSDPVDAPKPRPVDSGDLPAPMGSSSRELDLSGAENLSIAGKLGMMHPFLLLLALGVSSVSSWGAMMMLFTWVAVVGGTMGGSKAVARRASDTSGMLAPSGAISRGFGAIGLACIAALLAGGLGETELSFYVLNGLWAAFTALAVKSASKTDAQSGWIAGASSQTAAALFFGVPLLVSPLIPWAGLGLVVKSTVLFSMASLYQTWKFMGSRGTNRSRAALNAAGAAAIGTLAFLPATAMILKFSLFEVACHLTVSLGTLMIPIWSMRDKLRPALTSGGGSGDAPSLTSSDRPALPSE